MTKYRQRHREEPYPPWLLILAYPFLWLYGAAWELNRKRIDRKYPVITGHAIDGTFRINIGAYEVELPWDASAVDIREALAGLERIPDPEPIDWTDWLGIVEDSPWVVHCGPYFAPDYRGLVAWEKDGVIYVDDPLASGDAVRRALRIQEQFNEMLTHMLVWPNPFLDCPIEDHIILSEN